MSHQYMNSGNLFDDVDDDTFLANSRPKVNQRTAYGSYANTVASSGPRSNYAASSSTYNTLDDIEQQRQDMLQRRKEIEERTLDSSARSISLLHDSEQIGVATAVELVKQREQLENTNKRLDEINTNLRFTQKHINGIKSVFSSLKNYISGKNEQPSPKTNSTASEGRPDIVSPLHEVVDMGPSSHDQLYNNHPSTRLRGLDENSQRPRYQGQSMESKRVNELLDANLDEMASAIDRLKGLGMKLGEEIQTQNDLIDNIQDKVETADMNIGRQNKQMNKILGK